MVKYDNNFTDELRQRLSIIDIVGRRVPLTKKGQNHWGCCPFHSEKTPSFSVNEEKGFYHCFGCGEHGDIISFLMKSENIDFISAIKELADMAGIKMPDYKPKPAAQIAREKNQFEILESATQIYQQKLFEADGAEALKYIRARGFTDEMIKKYRIGYAPKNNIISGKMADVKTDTLIASGLVRTGDYGPYDFFRSKLMFPIFNPTGDIIAFSGRSLDGSEPKYINSSDSEIFHKRRSLMGLNFARDSIHRANRSIVVEGQIDAIKMQMNGFGETVAPLGTALTEDQVGLLCKSNRNITFCFDGDGAGQKAATRALSIVAPFIRDNSDIRFAFAPTGSDPDDILKSGGSAAMKKIIDNAANLIDFLWKSVNENFATSSPNGKAQGGKWIQKWLEKISDQKFRQMLSSDINNLIWHNWKKVKNKKELELEKVKNIKMPKLDNTTQNKLIYVVNTYTALAEKYADFLATLNINFENENDTNLNISETDSEKFIISIKIKNHLEKLNAEKKYLTLKLLSGEDSAKDKFDAVNSDIEKYKNKLHLIISSN